MSIVLSILGIVAWLLSLFFWLWKERTVSLQQFLFAIILKVGFLLFINNLYLNYYGHGDAGTYFSEGRKIAQLLSEDPTLTWKILFSGSQDFLQEKGLAHANEPRAMLMDRITYLFSFIGAGSFWLTSIYFVLLSFTTAWFFYKALVEKLGYTKYAFLALFAFPGPIAWTSGIFKESVALAILYYLAFVVIQILTRSSIKWYSILFALLSCFLLWKLKYYVAILFIPSAVALIAAKSLGRIWKLGQKKELITFFSLLTLLLFFGSLWHYNLRFENIAQVIYQNHQLFVAKSKGHQLIQFYKFDGSVISYILNAPIALFSGLFRPFIWEAWNLPSFLQSLENLAVLFLFIAALFSPDLKYRKFSLTVVSLIIYIAVASIFITFSTPNMGTLSRFKVVFSPFFVLLIVPYIQYLQSILQKADGTNVAVNNG